MSGERRYTAGGAPAESVICEMNTPDLLLIGVWGCQKAPPGTHIMMREGIRPEEDFLLQLRFG